MSTPTEARPTHSPRAHSIDLSLELERQLAMEETDSLPPMSPTHARPSSLDPQVLSSIVLQLRESLAAMTKERDDLAALSSGYLDREANIKDGMQHLTDRYTATLEELNAAKAKAQEDAENISMLRAKVEESRRGLMKLQTESRRTSVMSLDTARAGQAALGPPSARRPQFTPLTGSRGHGRGASISDSIHTLDDVSADHSPPRNTKRLSGFFGRSPPAALEHPETAVDLTTLELTRLRKELAAARDELEETRAELTEMREAKDASEMCVTALRAFIAENGVGENAVPGAAAPPSLAISTPQEEKKGGSGWGFKMWRRDTVSAAPSVTSPSASVAPTSPELGATTPALSQKITGFFGGARGSEYASSSIDRRSDVSSVEESEPLSPLSDVPQHAPPAVMVRTASSVAEPGASLQDIADEHVKNAGDAATDAPMVAVAL